MASHHLADWTGAAVAAECTKAYNAYQAAKTDSYRAYFQANAGLKAADHDYKAADLASALPSAWASLQELLPKSERHLHHLSGNSSQVVALGVLGVAAKRDPSLSWLWEALSPLPPPASPAPQCSFEFTLQPDVLDEQPRQTSLDVCVDDASALLCIEAKWTEAGIGSCSCGTEAKTKSDCSDKVLDRQAYWDTARDIFGLPARHVATPCALGFTYQAVRNVAAAKALAKEGQQPVFGLLYDAENPYFAGFGTWPGWPTALEATLNEMGAPVRFASASWQELVELAPLDEPARKWAAEKHGLQGGVIAV